MRKHGNFCHSHVALEKGKGYNDWSDNLIDIHQKILFCFPCYKPNIRWSLVSKIWILGVGDEKHGVNHQMANGDFRLMTEDRKLVAVLLHPLTVSCFFGMYLPACEWK